MQSILEKLRPGQKVYIPGASGEILALTDALYMDPSAASGVHFVSCFVPGMNAFDYAGLQPDTRVTTFMLLAAMRESFEEGRINLVPRSYTGAADILADMRFDVAIVHVAPPDRDGRCSFGIASDFGPLIWPHADYRIAVVNPEMPAMPRGPRLDVAEADCVVEARSDLVTTPPSTVNETSRTIAKFAAELVPDGALVQSGIGGAPGAVPGFLTGHRNLQLRSGMANDWFQSLHEAGALDPDADHVAGIAFGSRGFYDFLSETDLVQFVTSVESHGHRALAKLDGLHAINGALEVDLFGQINVEWQVGRIFSGVGGGPDFARAALNSPGGRSIIALPATAKKGTISRISTRLQSPANSMSRCDADTIVTEYGVAELSGLSIDQRAEALIAIAAPEFRYELAEDWRRERQTF